MYALDIQCNPVCTAYACALAINRCVSHRIRSLWMRTLPTEKQLCWSQYSGGKKYQNFILSLMVFPYSNICFCLGVKRLIVWQYLLQDSTKYYTACFVSESLLGCSTRHTNPGSLESKSAVKIAISTYCVNSMYDMRKASAPWAYPPVHGRCHASLTSVSCSVMWQIKMLGIQGPCSFFFVHVEHPIIGEHFLVMVL